MTDRYQLDFTAYKLAFSQGGKPKKCVRFSVKMTDTHRPIVPPAANDIAPPRLMYGYPFPLHRPRPGDYFAGLGCVIFL